MPNINYDSSRRKTREALDIFEGLINEYPNGIEEIFSLPEKEKERAKAWVEREIRKFGNGIASIRYKKFSFFRNVTENRNKIAHAKQNLDDAELAKRCSYLLQNASTIKKELEENIERLYSKDKEARQFEKSATPNLGSREEKKLLVDAIERSFSEGDEEQEIEFPQTNYGNLVKDVISGLFSSLQISKNYIKNHTGLAQNIKRDLLKGLKNLNDSLSLKNPFIQENAFIESIKKLAPKEIANKIDDIEKNYNKIVSSVSAENLEIKQPEIAFNFYNENLNSVLNLPQEVEDEDNSLHKLFSEKEIQNKLEIISRNLIKDMDASLLQRKTKWELEKIEEERKALFKTLLEKISNFIKIEKLLSPFINDLGRLWDLSIGQFNDYGFEILQTFASLLEKDEALQELASMLGRHSREEAKIEKELREKIVVKNEWRAHPSPRGMIEGITYSNDVSSILPSELALWKHRTTKPLFKSKFMKKELLSFKYKLKKKENIEKVEFEEVAIGKKEEEKGPIIICVDTSGSMSGTPENIAKTIVFALAKIALKEKRRCYLISFSCNIETIELTDFKGGKSIEKLVAFLRMSFNGGTDASRALQHSLKLLQEEDWHCADVLVVSDFVMNNLPSELEEAINAEKEKETRFFSLVIGRSGNPSVIDCFSENWAYNLDDKDAKRNLIVQMRSVGKR